MARQQTLEAILAKFERVERSGASYKVLCPAHADKNPSLSISQTSEGKILFKCHAGCTFEQIIAKLGEIEVASYDYTDENGKVLYQSVRFEPKAFKQRQPINGHWHWNVKGVRPVLYNLPEILKAERIVIVEGEKDVETLRAMGIVATTSSGGAKNWREEYVESLRGKHVVITPDNDAAGEGYLEAVARSITGKAASVKVARIPEKFKDVSDWNPSYDGYLWLIEHAELWTDKPPDNWRAAFHSLEDFENAPPLSFAIEGFLQNEAITAIAGLSGHGKTFVALSIARALLFGPGKLWNLFPVTARADRVVYLIPESSITPFKHRLQLLGVYGEIATDRLLTRTLSKGPTPKLDDKAILWAVRGAHVVIDTGVRFVGDADESSASEVARGLSEDLLGLLRAGARSVIPLFHSSKAFVKEPTMQLENMIRGSGELGAILATAWGIKQIDRATNTIHVENLKPRDFQPVGPFQIVGRPYIDRDGDFALLKSPDECGTLSDEQPSNVNAGRSNKTKQEARAANIALYRSWIEREPALTHEEARARFSEQDIKITTEAIRGYAHVIRKEKQ
jgi:5S rRNA maturation endonuclease (ribonuclease M5)